jgi:hypothetical protein
MFEYEIFLRDDLISVYHLSIIGDEIDLDLQDFWKFLNDKDMISYSSDFFDASQNDGHGQIEGDYSFEEYFHLPYEVIKKDLAKYIKHKKLL